MKCPNCSTLQHHVVDTRPKLEDRIWRRRECLVCKHRWNTKEILDERRPDGRKRDRKISGLAKVQEAK